MQISKLSCANKITYRIINILFKFCCYYLLVHVKPHRDYNWIIYEELLLSRLSEIVFIQYKSL